ncbi:expressed protein, partial [Phakopsora pachyrhizi]
METILDLDLSSRVDDVKIEKRDDRVSIIPVIRNLSSTLREASWRIERFDPKKKTNWGCLKLQKRMIKVSETKYYLIRSDFLPKIRYSIFSLHNKLKPRQDLWSKLESQAEMINCAHSIMPISDLLVSTMASLTDIYRNKSSKHLSSIRQVPLSRIIITARETEEMKSLWLKLIELYTSYLEVIPKRLDHSSKSPLDRAWEDAVSVYGKFLELVSQSICKINCCEEVRFPYYAMENFCFYHHGSETIFIPDDQFEWQMGLLPNRLRLSNYRIDRDLWCEINFEEADRAQLNFNLTNLRYLNSLREQVSGLKKIFYEVTSKDLTIDYDDVITYYEKDEILELSQLVTEHVLNAQIAIKLSINNYRDSLRSDGQTSRLTKSQLNLAQRDINKIYHCWSTLVESLERYLSAFEAAYNDYTENVDEAQVVLYLEIGWKFDICFEFIDHAIGQLTTYERTIFLEDFDSLGAEVQVKIRLIKFFIEDMIDRRDEDNDDNDDNDVIVDRENVTLIRELNRSNLPMDLRINYNSDFLRTWARLLGLFKLFINKASQEDRQRMNLHSILKKDQLILLVGEIYRWLNNYCLNFRNDWVLSDDGTINETVDKMIDSIKTFHMIFFKVGLDDRIVTDGEWSSSDKENGRRALERIEHLDLFLSKIDRTGDNDSKEETELKLW